MSKNQVIADERPGLSFREKSLWISMSSTLVVYAYYFWRALVIPDPGAVGLLFAKVVVLLIAVQIAGHIVLAVRARPEGIDERDRQVSLLASRNAYYVFASGTAFALGVIALGAGGYWSAHAVLLTMVLGDLAKAASQLFYYRRGW